MSYANASGNLSRLSAPVIIRHVRRYLAATDWIRNPTAHLKEDTELICIQRPLDASSIVSVFDFRR